MQKKNDYSNPQVLFFFFAPTIPLYWLLKFTNAEILEIG